MRTSTLLTFLCTILSHTWASPIYSVNEATYDVSAIHSRILPRSIFGEQSYDLVYLMPQQHPRHPKWFSDFTETRRPRIFLQQFIRTKTIDEYTIEGSAVNIGREIESTASTSTYLGEWSDRILYTVTNASNIAGSSRLRDELKKQMTIKERLGTSHGQILIQIPYVIATKTWRNNVVAWEQQLVAEYCNRGSILYMRHTRGYTEAMLHNAMQQMAQGLLDLHRADFTLDLTESNTCWRDKVVPGNLLSTPTPAELSASRPGPFVVKIDRLVDARSSGKSFKLVI